MEYTFVPSVYMKVYVVWRWVGVLSSNKAEAIRAELAAARKVRAIPKDVGRVRTNIPGRRKQPANAMTMSYPGG